MERSGIERKLTVILSADVAGYSRLMGEDEEMTLRTLMSYREVIDELIGQHRGRVFGSAGDSVVAEFPSTVDVLRCAEKIPRELDKRNAELPEDRRMHFRIGINLGDVIVEGDNLYGDGVNIAARVEGLADPGGICISQPVYDQVKKKIDLGFLYLGEREVKNIAEPIGVYKVQLVPVEEPRPKAAAEPKAAHQLPDSPSIVVLPFANMSADAEQEYFADGITEDLITALSKISGLFVIARNSSFTYKGKAVEVKKVSRELGVRYVLEGSVRKAGNRVRITAQLIDATTGHHLWADRFDRDLTDVFALQDEITTNVVSALQVKLLEGEQARVWRRSTESLEAWDCLTQALDRGAVPMGRVPRRGGRAGGRVGGEGGCPRRHPVRDSFLVGRHPSHEGRPRPSRRRGRAGGRPRPQRRRYHGASGHDSQLVGEAAGGRGACREGDAAQPVVFGMVSVRPGPCPTSHGAP